LAGTFSVRLAQRAAVPPLGGGLNSASAARIMLAMTAAPLRTARFDSRADLRVRVAAGLTSLVVGTVLLAAKYTAYQLTMSTAILSDAMESIVNVVAAIFAVSTLVFAAAPADRGHPYGHGKIEFFSATFEGGMIAFAALLIIYQAGVALWTGVTVREIDLGLIITAAAGIVNLGLGVFLVRVGRHYRSLTLVADGQHVLSDFWTSAGVIVGLLLVRLTGIAWFDPVVAAIVGVNLAWTGARLVRHAAGGLLDEEDPELLRKLLDALNASAAPGIISIHRLRAIRSGRFTHTEADLVVPEFWSVERAHAVADVFEQRIITASHIEGEVIFHVDPCRRAYCTRCDVADCPIRVEPFRVRQPFTVEEIVQTDDAAVAA
jgi:cation diffusion facilitator family transporter